MHARASLALLLVANMACSSGDDEALGKAEGMYQIQSHTNNEAACEPGGESLLGDTSDTFLLAHTDSFLGQTRLDLRSCSDLADCRTVLADLEAGVLVGSDFIFSVSKSDGDSLVGNSINTGFGMDGTCTEGGTSTTTVTLTGEQLSVRQERVIAADYPADGDGFCTTDRAAAAAADEECSQLEALEAVLVEAL